MREYLPIKHHSCCEVKNQIEVDNDYAAILDNIAASLQQASKTLLYTVLYDKVVKDIRKALVLGFGKDFDSPFMSTPEMNRLAVMEANIQRFSAAKSIRQVQEINRLVASGVPFTALREEVRKINEQFNVNWLKTETSTAYATGLNVGDWMAKSASFKFARWRQINRDTKRESHTRLDGKIWETNKLPIIPPADWNCGCRLEYLEEGEVNENDVSAPDEFISELKQSESNSSKYASLYDQMKRYGFNVHKGKTGEVFNLTKTYASEFNVDSLGYANSGRRSVKEIISPEMMIADSRSFNDVKRMAFGQLSDYRNRLLQPSGVITQKNYKYIVNVHDVISRPHEVYLTSTGANTYLYKYMKFYNDGGRTSAIIVMADLSNKGFVLKSISKTINADKYRNGLIVFNSKASWLN